MDKKKMGWIGAVLVALTVVLAVFVPGKAENPKKQEESFVSLAEMDGGEEWRREEIPFDSEMVVWTESEESFQEESDIDISFYEPKGILLYEENFDNAKDSFGFEKASRRNGKLYLAENMSGSELSTKKFDHLMMGQSFVEVSFDWTADFTSKSGQCGLEFRDLYGRLIFAIAGRSQRDTGKLDFLCSAAGEASNAGSVVFEPEWISYPYAAGASYHIFFRADFRNGKVSALIQNEQGDVVGTVKDADTKAAGLAKMIAASYHLGSVETIDNFRIYGPDDAGEFPLAGKKAIAFGDSIIDGHLYKAAGFVEFLAEKEGMVLEHNYANNGARIMLGGTVDPATGLGGSILDCQVNAAAIEKRNPDYIIFDGGANDAYSNILKKMGSVNDTDTTTFAGAFRHTIRTMHQNWPDAKIIYVVVHKLTVREAGIQEQMRRIELAICADMGVEVADLYTRGWDTTDASMNQKYAFDALNEAQIPVSEENSTGVHPNFAAMEELYIPVVSDAMKRAGTVQVAALAEGEEIPSETPDDAGEDWEEPAVSGEEITSIQFPSLKYRIAAGRKVVLEPEIEPSGASKRKLNWKITSNGEYASIDVKKGACTVTTKKSGAGKTVTVVAEASDGSGVQREVQILLMKNQVTKVSVKPKKQSVKAGNKVSLRASVKTNGSKVNKKLAWTCSDDNYVTLKTNKDGSQCIVTAKAYAAGKTVTITVRSTDGTDETSEVLLRIK